MFKKLLKIKLTNQMFVTAFNNIRRNVNNTQTKRPSEIVCTINLYFH